MGEHLRIRRALEAILFIADKPVSRARLIELVDAEEQALARAIEMLKRDHDGARGGLQLVELRGGLQLRTAPDLAPYIHALLEQPPTRLSRAALETLSVVAYRQPISRAEVESIRGVDSSGMLRKLVDLELIRVAGRAEGPGRPLLYATSEGFLDFFGLSDLDELPKLREIEDLDEAHIAEATDVPEEVNSI